MKDNKKQGFGHLKTKSGEFFGFFNNDQMDLSNGFYKKFEEAEKSIQFSKNVTYKGQLNGDKPNGCGQLFFGNGAIFSGNF